MLPLIVIFTYLALVKEMMYFSEFSVVPLLLPLSLLTNVVPSVEVAIAKLYCLSFPLYHAISTLQIVFFAPKSARIHEPTSGFDHLVLRLLSIALEGGLPVSNAFAVTPFIERLLLQVSALALLIKFRLNCDEEIITKIIKENTRMDFALVLKKSRDGLIKSIL